MLLSWIPLFMLLLCSLTKLVMSITFKSISNTCDYYIFINAGFQGLLRLKKLRVLNVGGNYLTTIPVLSALPSLKALCLGWNRINSSQLRGVYILLDINVCSKS